MAEQIAHFGTLADGRGVHAIALSGGGLRASVLTKGAILQSLYLDGVAHSLTLGFTDLAPYADRFSSFGAVIGPVVNRIGGASAVIDGRTHHFDDSRGAFTLHGGPAGSHHAVWQIEDHGPDHVTLTLDMADGAGGFPGNRRLTATYRLDATTLHLTIDATTDAATLMNVAHHGYWNMDGSPTWAGHILQVHADRVLPTTAQHLPTGEIADLAGHPHDLRQPRRIAPGDLPPFDHSFCLADGRRALTPALRLTGASGTAMEIATTEPGIQVFGAATIDPGDAPTVHGRPYGTHAGLAFEPQFWPDAPNHPAFPPIVLHPGTAWRQHTTFQFTRG